MSRLFDDLYNSQLTPEAAEEFARARTADPETSHAAAASVDRTRLREIRGNVLTLFNVLGAMTQHDLVKRYHARYGAETPESSIRTRCHELVEGGNVVNTGRTVTLPSGRRAVIWAAKDGGQ